MTETVVWLVLAGVLLIAVFFSALACYAFRTFSRSRLDEVCRQRGREARFGEILRHYEDALLAAEGLFALISVALVAVVFTWRDLWSAPGDGWTSWLIYLAELLAFFLLLAVAGLVLPWTIARVAGEKFLYRAWPVAAVLVAAARPFLALAREIDKMAHRLSGLQEPDEGDATAITEEIRTVVDEGQREGLLESEARTMIHRVIELQQEDVAAIMTPRTDMDCIPADSTLEEARRQLLEAGHSRIPVVGETTDDIVGILYAKDLLKYTDVANGDSGIALADIVREPFYVPETTGIDTLLEAMRRKRVHMAIVLDEYGGVAGLVTLEDILEEIVGEIVDEYDTDEEDGVRVVSQDTAEVDARVHIDDLNERFAYDLPEDGDFETVGGFVITECGRVPEPGEQLTWRNLRITVVEADKRKIAKLRIQVDPTLVPAAPEET